MDITKGFQLDTPDIFVPWDIDERALDDLFKEHSLRQVTAGYYTTSCTSLNGLNCMLGFHFNPRHDGYLAGLEFFRKDYGDKQKSFDDFQRHFEIAFGPPQSITRGDEGFDQFEWKINDVQIVHYMFDRFGLEEHMRIRKLE